MSGKILTEFSHIKFDLNGKPYCFSDQGAHEFVLSLQTSAEKTSLQFGEVVACRSITFLKPGCSFYHEQRMWGDKGPFTYEQFLRMTEHKPGISNEEWYRHMVESSKISVLS